MRIAARLFLLAWLMVFGGCAGDEHDHDHDRGRTHADHDHDAGSAREHGTGSGDGTGGGHRDGSGDKDGEAKEHGSGTGGGTGGGKRDGSGDRDGDRSESGKAPINTHCPLNPTEVVDEEATAEFAGQTIAFCCKKCAAKFESMNDDMKTAVLAKVKK